jgi:hypothetical protein
VKENLKIRVNSRDEKHEVQKLFFALGFNWQLFGAHNQVRDFTDSLIAAYIDEMCIRQVACDKYFRDSPNKEITLPELRELARPKEYLNDKFELVKTNQPDDGFILVPDGAVKLVRIGLDDYDWCVYYSSHLTLETLWQRENKVENKGRFLHQWAYEAFGRGEDLLLKMINNKCTVLQVNSAMGLHIFDDANNHFSLKPQTIQIGSRTINKPISVKPEIGAEYFVVDLHDKKKYDTHEWTDHDVDNLFLERGLIHLTKDDAINHTDALLELMK